MAFSVRFGRVLKGRSAFMNGQDDLSNVGLSFYAPLTTTIALSRGTGSPTFTRATTKSVVDWEGVIRTALSGEACFTGARRVQNTLLNTGLLGAVSPSTPPTGWTPVAAGGTISPTASLFYPGNQRIDFTVSNNREILALTVNCIAGHTYVLSAMCEAKSGTLNDYVLHLVGVTATLSGNPAAASACVVGQRVSTTFTCTVSGTATFRIGLGCGSTETGTGAMSISGPQLEDVTGQSNQNPSEYVSVGVLSAPYQGANVDGVQYFATQNGNTVTNNVVTQAPGALISNSVLLGYNAEEARTNLCLWSEDFSNASWVKSAATIGGSTAMPDGTTGTVNKIQEDNTTAVHIAQQTFTKAASALTYAFSVYMKQAERTIGAIQVYDGTANGNTLYFNLANGTVGSNAVIGTGFTSVAASVVAAANGFYRCIVTFTTNTATSLVCWVLPASADGTKSYTGTTGSGVFAWGAELEQAAFATSYIKTQSAAVTRNADVLTYLVTGNVDATNGTMYAEPNLPVLASVPTGILAVNDNSSNNRIDMRYTGSGAGMNGFVTSGGVNQASFAGLNPFVAGSSLKIATVWSPSNAKQAAGGLLSSILTIASPPVGMSAIKIGLLDAGANSINGTIRNVRFWTRALADLELIQLTR